MNFPEEDEWWKLGNIDTITCPSPDPNLAIPFREPSPMQFMQIQSPSRDLTSIPFQDDMMQVYDDRMTPGGSTYQMMQTMQNTSYSEMHTLHAETSGIPSYEQPSSIVNGDYMDNGLGLDVGPPHYFQQQQDPNTMQNHQQQQQQQPQQQQQQHSVMQQMLTSESPMNQNHMSSQNVQSPMSGQQMHMQQQQQQQQQQPQQQTPQQGAQQQTPQGKQPASTAAASRSKNRNIQPRQPNGASRKKGTGANQNSNNTVGAVLAKANKLAAASSTDPSQNQALPNPGGIEMRMSMEHSSQVAQLSMEIAQLTEDQQKRGVDHSVRLRDLEGKRAQIFFEALRKQHIDVEALQRPAASTPAARPPKRQTNSPYQPQYLTQQQGQQQQQMQQQQPVSIQPAPQQQQQQTQYYTTTTTATTTPQARRQTQQQQQQQQILSAPGMPQIQLQTTTHSRRAPPLYKQVQLTYVTQPSSSSGGTYQITTSQPQIVLQTQQSGGGGQQQQSQQQQQPQQQQTVQLQLQQVQQVQVSSSAQNQQLQHLQQQHQQQQQLQHPTQPYREPSVREVVQVVVGSSANGNGVQGPIMVRQQQGAPIPATLQHVSTASISSIPSTSTGLSMNSPVASVLRSQLQQQQHQQGGPAGQQQQVLQVRNGGVAVNSRQRQPVATLHMLQQQQQDANRMQQQQHQLSQQQQQPHQQTFMQQPIKQEVVVQRPPPVQVPKLNPAQCAKRIEEKKLQRAQRLRDGLQCLADRLCEPDTDTPFDSVSDAMQRLLPFGLYHEPHLSDDTLQHADTQLLRAFIGLDERQKQLEKRLRRVVLSDKLSNPEHQELNLLLQLEGEYEKRKLEEEKEMVTDETRADFITNSTLIAGLREAGISDPKGQSRLGAAPVKTIGLGTYEYHPFCDIPPSTPRPPPSPSPPPRTRRSPSKSPLKSPLSSPASSRYGSRSRRQSSSSFMSPSESITSPAPSAAPSVVRYARRTERGAARKEPRQPEVEAEKEEKKPVIPVVEEISPAPVLKREPSLSPLKSPIRSPPTPARRLPPKMLAKAADRKAREQQGEGEEGVPAPMSAHQARKSPQKKETKPPPQRLSSLGRSSRGSASVAANTATTIIAAIPPALAPPPLRATLPPPAAVLSNHVTTTIAQSIANYNRRTSLVESNLEDEASDGSASPEFDVPEPVTPVTIKSVPVPPSRSFENTVVKEDVGSRFTSPPKSTRLPPPRREIVQKAETQTTRGMQEKVVKEEGTREKNHLNESTAVIPSISERITESRLPLRLRKSRVHEVKEEDENRIPSRDFSSSPVPSVASNESIVERKPLKLKISLGARPPSQASSLVEERVVKVEDADDEGSRREKEKKHKKHKKKKKKRKHGDEDAPVEEMECEQKPEPFLDTEEPCCSKSLPPPVDAPPAPPRLVLKFSLGKNSVKTSASPMTSSSSPHREPSELASGPAPDSRPTSACLKVPPLKISRGRSESPAIGKADSPLPPVVPKLRIPSAKLRRSNTPKRVPEASAPVVPHPPPPSALVDDGTPAPPPAKIPRLKIRFGTASASTTVVAEPAAVVVATPKPAPPVVAPPSPPRVVVKKQEPSQSPEENALRIQFSDGEDSDNDDGMRASDEALARCGLAMRSSPPKEHSSASMWTLQ